jgi:hypothetical protein
MVFSGVGSVNFLVLAQEYDFPAGGVSDVLASADKMAQIAAKKI